MHFVVFVLWPVQHDEKVAIHVSSGDDSENQHDPWKLPTSALLLRLGLSMAVYESSEI